MTATTRTPTLAVDQEVEFDDGRGNTLTGVITRVWDKPATDPYVTVVTSFEDRPRKFVRMSSHVQRTAPFPAGDSSLPDCIEYTADQDSEEGC